MINKNDYDKNELLFWTIAKFWDTSVLFEYYWMGTHSPTLAYPKFLLYYRKIRQMLVINKYTPLVLTDVRARTLFTI